MHIHYIQHEPFEDLGCIREWLNKSGQQISYTHIFEKVSFLESIPDLLIIMGGSMSAYDDHIIPWLKEEKAFIKKVIEAGSKVLGICLGAQLLANVLGAKVYPAKSKEIGWFEIKMNDQVLSHPLLSLFPVSFTTMHWHGDTFDLPTGAIRIASSECTLNQGFIFDNRVVALQFHPEMDEKTIQGMIDETGELIPSQFIQSIDQIRKGYSFCEGNNNLVGVLLDKLSEL
mgnify:CR=1 FL=1